VGDTGYRYTDAANAHDGIGRILLKSGRAGIAKLLWKAQDANLPAFGLPLDDTNDVVVQLRNDSNAHCWEATYGPGSVTKNEAGRYEAKF
jgi:hypothetical protein